MRKRLTEALMVALAVSAIGVMGLALKATDPQPDLVIVTAPQEATLAPEAAPVESMAKYALARIEEAVKSSPPAKAAVIALALGTRTAPFEDPSTWLGGVTSRLRI